MAWVEAYKWPESKKSVENPDFLSSKKNPEKKIKKIDFKFPKNLLTILYFNIIILLYLVFN